MYQRILPFLAGASLAAAHGLVTSPETRRPGPATAEVCSQILVDFYLADNTSYPELLLRQHPEARLIAAGYDPALCNQWLCKGFQFGDNEDRVLSLAPGDVVDMEVFIRIPHLGHANVSVVDAGLNEVIGEPLKLWEDGYADGALFPNLPPDQTDFSVTVPELEGRCTVPGECVIQWYWFGQGQTYESCIDFTVPEVGGEDPDYGGGDDDGDDGGDDGDDDDDDDDDNDEY